MKQEPLTEPYQRRQLADLPPSGVAYDEVLDGRELRHHWQFLDGTFTATDSRSPEALNRTVQQILDDGMRVLSVGEGSLVIDQRGDFGLATCVAITAKGLELFDEGI